MQLPRLLLFSTAAHCAFGHQLLALGSHPGLLIRRSGAENVAQLESHLHAGSPRNELSQEPSARAGNSAEGEGRQAAGHGIQMEPPPVRVGGFKSCFGGACTNAASGMRQKYHDWQASRRAMRALHQRRKLQREEKHLQATHSTGQFAPPSLEEDRANIARLHRQRRERLTREEQEREGGGSRTHMTAGSLTPPDFASVGNGPSSGHKGMPRPRSGFFDAAQPAAGHHDGSRRSSPQQSESGLYTLPMEVSNSPRDSRKDSLKSSMKDVPKDLPKDTPKDSPADSPYGSPRSDTLKLRGGSEDAGRASFGLYRPKPQS